MAAVAVVARQLLVHPEPSARVAVLEALLPYHRGDQAVVRLVLDALQGLANEHRSGPVGLLLDPDTAPAFRE